MQSPDYLAVLRERYRFEEWGTAGDDRANVPPLTFAGSELPGWRLVRQTRRQPEGHPPLLRTMWQGATAEHLVGIDIHECATAASAREYLLQRLGDFQGPVVPRDDVLGIGDIAFATTGETTILFVRGSAVIVVHAAGRRTNAVTDAARAVDALLRRGAGGGPA